MRFITKTILLLLFLTGSVVQNNLPININKTEAKTEVIQATNQVAPSGDADKVEDYYNGEIIGTYKLGNGKFNVVSIPTYKNNIMDKYGIKFETKLIIHTKNTLECGDENGFCIGFNHADAGPLQINQIHDRIKFRGVWIVNPLCIKDPINNYQVCPHRYSEYLVYRGKEAYNNSLRTGDWKTTNAIRDTLYNFQVARDIPIMVQRDKGFCYGTSGLSRVRCQAILHNGSSRKEYYGNKAKISYGILKEYYK